MYYLLFVPYNVEKYVYVKIESTLNAHKINKDETK